jgi:ribosomal protein S18 acetylase RimI-like enzyme
MISRITISHKNGSALFFFDQLEKNTPLDSFSCFIDEYNNYLNQDALSSQNDHIALTWLLRERDSEAIISYMSLIADAIKLSATEKELHNLNYPFKTIPAIKIAKLAVSQSAQKNYKGIGTYMIDKAAGLARICNRQLLAARFLTVDADIEHDEGVMAFYEKNGFIPNAELFNKNRKTISMRKDIYL